MSETHDDAIATDWRKDGRCSACEHFRSDFGEPPDVYGHCKIYPRNGSREATDYACGEYRALPGFSALTQSTSQPSPRVAASTGGGGIPSGGFSPGRRPGRPGPVTPPHASVVRRRRVDDDDDDDDPVLTPSRPAERPAAFSAPPQRSPVTGARVVTESESTDQVTRTLFSSASGASGAPAGASLDRQTLGAILVDLVEQHIGLEEVEIGRKWEDGNLILQPGDDDLKEVTLPIKTFFHKIVMLRDRLRVLEQKINANPSLADGEKVELQQYISRCYGSLTTFNVLFKNREDRFTSKGDE